MDQSILFDATQNTGHRGHPRLAMRLGVAGCSIGALAILLPLWPLWGFYKVPAGTSMRPMALTYILGIFAATGPLIALPLSVGCLAFGWRHRKLRWVALVGVLLSVSAYFSGFGLFYWIVAVRHFVLDD